MIMSSVHCVLLAGCAWNVDCRHVVNQTNFVAPLPPENAHG
jgi:hypothetical protein